VESLTAGAAVGLRPRRFRARLVVGAGEAGRLFASVFAVAAFNRATRDLTSEAGKA
jgi:hypothetical protein